MQPTMVPETRAIACCISTLHRADGLAATLASVAAQRASLPTATRLIAIVVSNDPADARPAGIVAQVRAQTGLEVILDAEPRRGVAFPRNRALEIARRTVGTGGAIVFIDDDEIATDGWLAALLAARERFGPGIVTGPVDPSFQRPPPDWVIEGGFFDATLLPTGTRRPWAFTNNVLLDASLIDEAGPRFQTEFIRVGEDRHFFQRLAQAGVPIRWVAEARVVESIPPDRVSAAWLVSRQRSAGRCVAPIERDLRGAAWSMMSCTAKGTVWIVLASIRQMLARRTSASVRARMQCAWGLGLLEGAWRPSLARCPVSVKD